MSKENRLGALAALCNTLGLDAILVTTPSNLYYFSGFRTTIYTRFNGVLQVPSNRPALVTSYVDEALAKQGIWGPVWIRDVRIHGPIQRADVVALYQDALRGELSRVKKLGVDSISLTTANELKTAFPGLAIEDISPHLAALRRIKDADEIADLRKASEIGIACLEKAREVLARPKVTEADLGIELESHARRLGADGFGYPILISTGEKVTAPHAPPLPNLIPPDAPFVRICFAPAWNGYTTSLIRTFCRSSISELTRTFERAFFTAMADLKVMLKPGASVQGILHSVAQSYERQGVRHAWGGDMGYSLGVSVHEPPRIGGTDDTRIEASIVLALMPGLRVPAKATFHHSDLYLVTETGCELLSPGLQQVVTY